MVLECHSALVLGTDAPCLLERGPGFLRCRFQVDRGWRQCIGRVQYMVRHLEVRFHYMDNLHVFAVEPF